MRPLFLLLAISSAAFAHIGSPDVFYEGNAGPYRLLVTMFDRRNRVHRNVLEQLKGAFPGAVLETAIEIDTKLRESQVFGQPITSYAPKSRAAAQYRALAEELSVYVQREKTPQPA